MTERERVKNRRQFWAATGTVEADTHWAFRSTFIVSKACTLSIDHASDDWYILYLDGKEIAEGPLRFHPEHPEYAKVQVCVKKGVHCISCHVHHYGTSTRLMPEMKPFLLVNIVNMQLNKELSLSWTAVQLQGYGARLRRINPCLGWIEWCDTRPIPSRWHAADFDDHDWKKAVSVKVVSRPFTPAAITQTQQFYHAISPFAQGPLVVTFGYVVDDLPAGFYLNALDDHRTPSQGCWRRYDLGKVCLGRPRFTIDAPEGTRIYFAHAESLINDRVSPFISLSCGTSCNINVFIARGGPQTFSPVNPLGGRYLEVQVIGDPGKVQFIEEGFIERSYYSAPSGSFSCSNPRLNTIWSVGVETLRSCAEDSIIDNPTRERGQWLGDAIVGMHIASAAFNDVRLMRRTLEQASFWAREDGTVAAMVGGQPCYVGSFASEWIGSCLSYFQLTGDTPWLKHMYQAAIGNCGSFEHAFTKEGIAADRFWNFIDWGYKPRPGKSDLALNLFVLNAFDQMAQWCRILNKIDDADHYVILYERLKKIVLAQAGLTSQVKKSRKHFDSLGYHCAGLLLRTGLVPSSSRKAAITSVKDHWKKTFPNKADAPRLSDPGVQETQLVSPYFSHFILAMLIENGEMDFVLNQYETCWGWILDQGLTTWAEVFDLRWSHCHQWSGCPTWQLSRYVLGLRPRFDLGAGHYEFSLRPGSLTEAQGTLPVNGTDAIVEINWKRNNSMIDYTVCPSSPVWIQFPSGPDLHDSHVEYVAEKKTFTIPVSVDKPLAPRAPLWNQISNQQRIIS